MATRALLNRIAELYVIEAEGRNMTVDERQLLWVGKSLSALIVLHDWLQKTPL